MRFRCRIDYQRALAEDPKIIQAWFALVQNTIAKYGIVDSDIYNFDKTGFLIGMLSYAKVVTTSDRQSRPRIKQSGNREWVSVIQGIYTDGWAMPLYIIVKGKYHLLSWYTNGEFPPTWRIHPSENGWTTNAIGLDWLNHFERYTKPHTTGGYRLLILDSYNSHRATEFDDFCKLNNIIPLCMPPHLSYILQPLDVGCFGLLKASYSKAIEQMIQRHITHITKDDFFPVFQQAFFASIGEDNIQAGFRATGLVPYNPETVISRLDFKPRTPTPSNSRPGTATSWCLKTPTTAIEAVQSSTTLKSRIARHQSSSPTHLYNVVDTQAKGISMLAHRLVLLEAENQELCIANDLLSKRRRAKKSRLQLGGSLSAPEADAIRMEKCVVDATGENICRGASRTERAQLHTRRCGNCSQTGHNSRTCQVVWETCEDGDSE